MVIEEELINNTSEVIYALSPDIAQRLAPFITLLKALGVLFFLYIIYIIYKAVIDWKLRKRVKRIEQKVNEIDKIVKHKK